MPTFKERRNAREHLGHRDREERAEPGERAQVHRVHGLGHGAEDPRRLNFEYPIKPGIPLDETVASFGQLKPDTLPIAEIAKHRKTASQLVDKVGFDR